MGNTKKKNNNFKLKIISEKIDEGWKVKVMVNNELDFY